MVSSMNKMDRNPHYLLAAAFLITLLSGPTLAQTFNPAIREELLAMEKADQDSRLKCTNRPADEQLDCFAEISRNIDQPNAKRLAEIFHLIGFPDTAKVGKEGLSAFMVLLQHVPDDDLRKKSLKPITRAFKNKELPPMAFANFVDRLRVHQGKRQLYGSNFDFKDGKLVMSPTKNLKKLESRRAAIGLPPLEEYVRELGELYRMAVVIPKR